MTPTKPPASVRVVISPPWKVPGKKPMFCAGAYLTVKEAEEEIAEAQVPRNIVRYVLPSPATRMAKVDNLEREALEAAMGGFADKSEEYLRWAERHDLYRIRPLARLELARRGEKKARKR